ncbi:hypothetical protein HMPREF1547_02276 [Blautia sp. KLE 1732]|nr:hypothetical protein HMPREF1547_02276 [Blautia sp. KLE 1732]
MQSERYRNTDQNLCFFRISGIIFRESFYNRTEMFAAGVSL